MAPQRCYRLVGSNEEERPIKPRNREIILSVENRENIIEVQPGDIVGLYVERTPRRGPGTRTGAGTGIVLNEGVAAVTVWYTNSSFQIANMTVVCAHKLPTGGLFSAIGAPLITAVISGKKPDNSLPLE